ncbi:hypothetical protein HMPREF1431_00207 [Helicobacter pylori GAMchJs106B]|nr:hypothetical protein HMPREF1431_00207 [Helicobacter pylori GAMchJs106B]
MFMECGSVFIKDERSKPYLMFFIFLKKQDFGYFDFNKRF